MIKGRIAHQAALNVVFLRFNTGSSAVRSDRWTLVLVVNLTLSCCSTEFQGFDLLFLLLQLLIHLVLLGLSGVFRERDLLFQLFDLFILSSTDELLKFCVVLL